MIPNWISSSKFVACLYSLAYALIRTGKLCDTNILRYHGLHDQSRLPAIFQATRALPVTAYSDTLSVRRRTCMEVDSNLCAGIPVSSPESLDISGQYLHQSGEQDVSQPKEVY